MPRDIHVNQSIPILEPDGTPQAPFTTISQAAAIAEPGDTVIIHEGTYREHVRPPRGGLSHSRRITYRAAPGEHVRLTGAEPITGWEPVAEGVWKIDIPRTYFGDFNPFIDSLFGDWLLDPPLHGPKRHLGQIIINDEPLTEVTSLEQVLAHAPAQAPTDRWTGKPPITDDWQHHGRVWFTASDAHTTSLWIAPGDLDPNEADTQITVRSALFYPDRQHVDWITVSGLEICYGATPWTPPTADQVGLIGPRWARGWIIEDCDIHHATCSAVSLGKDGATGDCWHTRRWDKAGYQYQLESVFEALAQGWSRESVGSHTIRRNHIHHCGQNAVVGHLGCVFSTIEDNDIHHIATRREFFGHEIAGIKLHAPIDVTIRHNHIHHCTLGIWLDWQAQGTRITRNLLHTNNRDLFIEVSHGPYTVDYNIFGSAVSIENVSEGGLYSHNLLLGSYRQEHVRDRATPYHLPHSTAVKGYGVIEGGDDRLCGNIFAGVSLAQAYDLTRWGQPGSRSLIGLGTAHLTGFPASQEEYNAARKADWQLDHEAYLAKLQPLTVRSNAYAAGAQSLEREEGAIMLGKEASFELISDAAGSVFLIAHLPSDFSTRARDTTAHLPLPPTRLSSAEFDDTDGSPLVFTQDLLGQCLDDSPVVGPLACLEGGDSQIQLW